MAERGKIAMVIDRDTAEAGPMELARHDESAAQGVPSAHFPTLYDD